MLIGIFWKSEKFLSEVYGPWRKFRIFWDLSILHSINKWIVFIGCNHHDLRPLVYCSIPRFLPKIPTVFCSKRELWFCWHFFANSCFFRTFSAIFFSAFLNFLQRPYIFHGGSLQFFGIVQNFLKFFTFSCNYFQNIFEISV